MLFCSHVCSHYISVSQNPSRPVCPYSPKLISQSSGTCTESIADQSASLCILQAVRGKAQLSFGFFL